MINKSMIATRCFGIALLGGLPFITPATSALADGASASLNNASYASVLASASFVTDFSQALAPVGNFVVTSVQPVGETLFVVLHEVGTASGTGIEFSIKAVSTGAAASAYVVGRTIEVSATAAGTILSEAGKLIAFIPNEVGQRLSHRSSYEG